MREYGKLLPIVIQQLFDYLSIFRKIKGGSTILKVSLTVYSMARQVCILPDNIPVILRCLSLGKSGDSFRHHIRCFFVVHFIEVMSKRTLCGVLFVYTAKVRGKTSDFGKLRKFRLPMPHAFHRRMQKILGQDRAYRQTGGASS